MLFIVTEDADEAVATIYIYVNQCCQVFDRNSDGYVSKSELYHTLKELGVNLSLEELNNKMKEADTNQDGCIDYAGN